MRPNGKIILILAAFLTASGVSAKSKVDKAKAGAPEPAAVESSDAAPAPEDANPFLSHWYDRITVSGFLNAGYVQTGEDNWEKNGYFYAAGRQYGGVLSIEGEAWTNIVGHAELDLFQGAVTPRELYVMFKNIWREEDGSYFSAKAGWVNLPFGEEYQWQNASENPMVLRTAAWPWGTDKGLVLFGRLGDLGWFGSVTDGSPVFIFPDKDDTAAKCLTFKLTYDPLEALHLSASTLQSGKTGLSSLILNNNALTPVGATLAAGGASSSTQMDLQAYEGDAIVKIGRTLELKGDYGVVQLNDVAPYDRLLRYYYGQVLVNLTSKLYIVGRYSAIGTFDGSKGYLLGGYYDNANAFGYDTKSLERLGAAVGFKINSNTVLKVEYDRDWVSLIDNSTADPGQRRATVAAEVVVKY